MEKELTGRQFFTEISVQILYTNPKRAKISPLFWDIAYFLHILLYFIDNKGNNCFIA